MAPKLESFHYNFEQRSNERLLSSTILYHEPYPRQRGCFHRLADGAAATWACLCGLAVEGWEFGRSDPRKVVFAAKMGLALTIISLLIFLRVTFHDLSKHSVWAILTVVVVFEFSIGIGLGVNICIYPIWAGEDLHNLVTKNFTGLAKSLEGCVNGYLQCVEYERVPSKILTYQAYDDPLYSGYRSAVQSTIQEDALLSFAIWEPPHGPYKMWNYPWKNYIRVSGALRHCAFMVMALHGCILSEIQAPPESRQIFSSELKRVGIEGAKVLRELGDLMKTMTKLNKPNFLFEVHEAAEVLQQKIDRKSYLLVNSESWEGAEFPDGTKGNLNRTNITEYENNCYTTRSYVEPPSTSSNIHSSVTSFTGSLPKMDSTLQRQMQWPARQSFNSEVMRNGEESRTYESASALSLATFSSLLIEFVARLQNLVEAFQELSEKANFEEPVDEPILETAGLWTRIRKLFLKNKELA
nr:PREDICTED: aluminum-activated malate transporter 9-like isoform X3 [Musa acuminata subsp. malaccensis]